MKLYVISFLSPKKETKQFGHSVELPVVQYCMYNLTMRM